ncbi:lipase maturation factor family protein [Alloacidobacterium dinghuense]|uniref:lipase maturation factor family protein n=1 Tax=Alloacidobacterium dinghuense TaxID=2763107 RepID=UPI002036C366|nr:lipase maturation factor family protein [Alloacidobacterium dinghuense]
MPAQQYLQAVDRSLPGLTRFWFAPTLFWFSTSNHALIGVTVTGLIASLLVTINVWPRLTLLVCFACFLSFVSAAGDFSNYQSDGMLLEAGFISLFFAPRGFWPGLGMVSAPSRASLFLLLWEWFRIYFESGLVKLLSGDQEWRHFTAMDEYYQNGPLPTWIGWYLQHLPHWFHAFTVGATLTMELALVFLFFLPRRFRIACFFIVTPWQIVVIATANYTFLNYLVLSQGFLLLDDQCIVRILSQRFRPVLFNSEPDLPLEQTQAKDLLPLPETASDAPSEPKPAPLKKSWRKHASAVRLAMSAVFLTWVFYVTTAELIHMLWRQAPLPSAPIAALEPFRIANQYGLFAVMTRGRYEIEFQGSYDGENWTAYPFKYKPQALNEPPRVYAPYQPRFDWNLWFASLGDWRQNSIVPLTEERLLTTSTSVIQLFAGDPFHQSPPKYVRAVLWQYWFTSMAEKRATGLWWKRQLLGLYAPALTVKPDGAFDVAQWPEPLPPHE